METVPDTVPREDRVRLRRTALIEFEIGRAPEAANGTIARACRTSVAAVTAVRKALEHPTPVASSAPDARPVT